MHLFKLTLLALLPAASACQKPPPDDTLELRIYDAPKGAVRAIVNTLNSTLWFNENKVAGRSSITPDGRLAVLATREVQRGAEALVDDVTKHPPAGDPTIELRYWVVLGRPAASPQPVVAELAEIQPALAEIARTQGPQTFTVAQRARLSSLNNETAKVQADRLDIHQTAVRTDDETFAAIQLSFAAGDRIDTRVHLVPDQTVVLGATGQPSGDVPAGATLYYLVRTGRAEAPRP